MKIQALALGTVLGFLVAIAPSCGQPMCSAANCDGCCKGTTCVAKPNNSNNTTCGTSGNMCTDCSASGTACDSTTFTCGTGGTGGGAGGGTAGGTAGGGVTCDGCRLANGTCQPRGTTRQNNNICGANGETCKACAAPTPACDNGSCIAPPKKVGDSCAADADCQATLGPTAICKQQNLKGSITYAGGMCTVPGCGASGTDDCPMGSLCLNLPRIYGEEVSACFVSGCGAMAPCRSGYGCFNLGSTTGCLPTDINNMDLELDTAASIGNPCTFNSDCRAPAPGAPAAGGACQPEVIRRSDGGITLGRDGGPQYTGNPGGQCTRICRIDEDCSADGTENFNDGICLGVSQTQAICFKGCAAPNAGQSNCRAGYICEQLRQNDGGLLPTGYCDARCDALGSTCGTYTDGGVRACLANGYCDFERPDAGMMTPDAGEMDAGAGGGSAGGGAAGGGSAGGGAAGGGSAAGGSAGGGSAAGGSAGGGSAGGGSAGGGSAAGGSAGGGTATCSDGGAVFGDGGC